MIRTFPPGPLDVPACVGWVSFGSRYEDSVGRLGVVSGVIVLSFVGCSLIIAGVVSRLPAPAPVEPTKGDLPNQKRFHGAGPIRVVLPATTQLVARAEGHGV